MICHKFFKGYWCSLLALCLIAGFSLQAEAAQQDRPLEKKELAVFADPTGAPLAFLTHDITKPLGLDIDIVKELQRRLGFTLKEDRIFPLDRQSAFNLLDRGKADLVVGGISYTTERAEIYDFTPVFLESGLTVLYSKRFHPEIKSASDIKGLRVAYQAGSTSAHYVKDLGAQGVAIHNNTLAYFLVAIGRVDGFIYDRPPISGFIKDLPNLNLEITQDLFGTEACRFAFALQKNSPYTKAISKAIDDMIADGTMGKLIEKWNAH